MWNILNEATSKIDQTSTQPTIPDDKNRIIYVDT